MLWQLLRGAGGNYSPAAIYDEGEIDNPDPSFLPLDPVDVAGQANLGAMNGRLHARFTLYALSLIMSVAVFVRDVQPPALDYMPSTMPKWTSHLQALAATTPTPILVPVAKALVLGVCSYFAVAKGTEYARAIFNGRRFSARCKVPPSTNLPDVVTLLQALSRLPGRMTFVEGDIRHFFHQLKLHQEISRFFCVRQHGTFWRWSTLPMGWSWSPFIAQSISMGMIIEVLENCGVSMELYKNLNQPPALIEVPDVLVAAVWYDNILLATTNANLGLKFYQKFRTMVDARHFNLTMKEWNLHHPRSLTEGSTHPVYLGLEFSSRPTKRQRSEDDKVNVLHWRHTEKRITTFKALDLLRKDGDPKSQLTPRIIAKICGSLMWDAHVAGIPLCRKSELIDLIRLVGTSARQSGWDSVLVLNEEALALLRGEVSLAIINDWKSLPRVVTTNNIFVATDSSDLMWGAIAWDDTDSPILSLEGQVWPDSIAKEHIFLKELLAATITIERLAKKHASAKIHVITDNTACAAVLRRLASSSKAGCELARRVDNALSASGCTLQVIIVSSADNPADEPSRNRPVIMTKLEYARSVIVPSALAFCRRRTVVPNGFVRPAMPPNTSIRHEEANAEKGELDWFGWDDEDPSTE